MRWTLWTTGILLIYFFGLYVGQSASLRHQTVHQACEHGRMVVRLRNRVLELEAAQKETPCADVQFISH